MKDLIVIFIDRIASKNQLQIKSIHRLGMTPIFFVTEKNDRSLEYLDGHGKEKLLESNFFNRISQVSWFLGKNKKHIHHIEVYPAGRFSWIYILLSNILSIRSICAERGDIQYYKNKMYSRSARFSMWVCYKYSYIIWYREFYMKDLLQQITAKKLFFLHNAIEVNEYLPLNKKDIDFLWLNRVIKERRSDWFISVLKKHELKNTVNYLIGLIPKSSHANEQLYVKANKPDNCIILEYTKNPFEYYARARFFVLPADIIFANNSLLEAMSYGVVPLISNMPGASLIVDDGKNGFIFNHDEQAFHDTVLKVLNLSETNYNTISAAARKKIIDDFSPQQYFQGLQKMYGLISYN